MQTALVTNDDGVDSGFLWALVGALTPRYNVIVAAPARQQSWVGRMMSRDRPVALEQLDRPVPTWSIDGSPSDCVNIALSHLLDTPPAVVVSGINIGFNITLPLVLSSGTVAAAIEGALWGLPAVATSMHLPMADFPRVTAAQGRVEGALKANLDAFAARTVDIVEIAIAEGQPGTVVHNFNGPVGCTPDTAVEETRLMRCRMPSLFERAEAQCRFRFRPPVAVDERDDTDATCVLERGSMSHTRIDFAALTG